MSLDGVLISEPERASTFAAFFNQKIKSITDATIVDQNVYNGVPKIAAADFMFMSTGEIVDCIKSIKMKNCEGYDRIPQRILVDGLNVLRQLHR